MAANAACLYASGDKAGAAMAAAGVALASVGAGAVVQAAKVTKTMVAASSVGKVAKVAGSGEKLLKPVKVANQAVGQKLYNSTTFGRASKLFGTKALSNTQGILNRPNSVLKIGWSQNQGSTVLRIGVGKTNYFNNSRNKMITTSKWHIDLWRK